MKITEKINFRQPKYMLPAILYFPLLGASYFIFDLFNAEKAEVTDKSMQTTEYLNPELPGAKTKGDGIGGKYENMTKAWGEDWRLHRCGQHRTRHPRRKPETI